MNKRPLCLFGVLFAMVLAGWLLFAGPPPPASALPDGQAAEAVGLVCRKETKNQKQIIYLKNANLSPVSGGKSKETKQQNEYGERRPDGLLQVYLDGEHVPAVGSTVCVSGRYYSFERAVNPGQMDMASYYRIRGVGGRLMSAALLADDGGSGPAELLYRFRTAVEDVYVNLLGEKEAGIVCAMVLGNKAYLDNEVKTLFQRNGISHILAISGLHVSMLGMGLYRLLRAAGVRARASAAAGCLLLLCYGAMTGFGSSTCRAVVMFCLAMLARVAGRTYDLATALSFALLLMLLEQPLYLQDAGFLLSFLAVAGMALVLPVLSGGRLSALLPVKALLPGISVLLTTLPVTLWFYYGFAPYALALNVLVVPCMGALLAAAIAAGLLGLICPQAAVVPAWVCRLIPGIYERGCYLCEALPGSYILTGRPSAWRIACYYVLLLFLLLLLGRERMGKRRRMRAEIASGALLLMGALMLIRLPAGFAVTMLDVGQGEAVVLYGTAGAYLIDGGSSDVSGVGRFRLLPFLQCQGIRRLDCVFVSHTDEDHISGIRELMEQEGPGGVEIGLLALPDIGERGEAYEELLRLARAREVPCAYVGAGDALRAGALSIRCLYPVQGVIPSSPNAGSMVLDVRYGSFSMLLTGDLEGEGEEALMDYLDKTGAPPYDVLKVAHHGSKNSTPERLLSLTRPEAALISCSEGNRYGHPGEALMDRLEKYHITPFVTKDTGAITLFTKNGEKLSIRQFVKER